VLPRSNRLRLVPAAAGLLAAATLPFSTAARDLAVTDAASLRTAVAAAQPGDRILLAAGNYGGGFHFAELRGAPDRPIILAAADPRHPPVFREAATGLHLSNPAHVELHDLVFEQLSANGLNIDDGGAYRADDTGAHHIVLRRIHARDIGTTGNQDGIKLSGLRDFRLEDCVVERWGTGGGSAIDLVGCHRGVITGCTIRHREPAPPNCTGVQCKGGTSDVAILRNRFEHAGGRGVNLGGSTGRPFFRPPLTASPAPGAKPHAEARALRVEGNTFLGGTAPVAFVGVDGAVVRFNTIERPTRWALRILQENRAPDFVPSRGGVFTDNLIIFDSAAWSSGGVNLGTATAPETFTFARNVWWCTDRPDRSHPALPTPEIDGTYGRDPATSPAPLGAAAFKAAP
jgi:hypothetical protein